MLDRKAKKLDEKLTESESIEKEQAIKDELAGLKKARSDFRLKRFRDDLIYSLVVSFLFGFVLWAWFPEEFSVFKSLALGVIWYLLIEELRIHRIFKNEN